MILDRPRPSAPSPFRNRGWGRRGRERDEGRQGPEAGLSHLGRAGGEACRVEGRDRRRCRHCRGRGDRGSREEGMSIVRAVSPFV